MDGPPLSILICTLEERAPQLRTLTVTLKRQASGVEILPLCDNRQMSIGAKRQRLLEMSQGQYVCFVDDDDAVAPNYLPRILQALRERPEATHCSLKGQLMVPGKNPKLFEHSTRYKEWAEVEGVYVRTPNHLNVIRRDLALQAGFPDISHGEDHDFSRRLQVQGTLTCEAYIPDILYVYQYQPKAKGPVKHGRTVIGVRYSPRIARRLQRFRPR